MGQRCWPATRAVTSMSRISSSLCITFLCWSSAKAAFDFARPLKKWQADWPESYHRMLRTLRERWPEGGRGIQEFVRVLRLHEDYPAPLVQQAIEQALSYGCPHLDGVLHCLHQLTASDEVKTCLELAELPHLQTVGTQPIDLRKSRTIVEIIKLRRP
jgi:hypothetical protein